MATESSRFFDSVDHDRQYAASDFAAYFGETGVYDAACGGDGLRVERAGAVSLRVLPGEARVRGYGYWLEAEEDEPFTMLVSQPSRYPRIDRVVLRLDTRLSERSAFLTLKQGTASSAPQPPALTREGDIYEISLAQVYLSPDRSLQATDITDEREDGEACGVLYRNGQTFPFCNNTVWDMHTVFTPGVYYVEHPNGGAPTMGVDPYMVLVSPVSDYTTAEQGCAQLWFDLVENKMYVRSTLGNNGAYGAFQPYPDAGDRYWEKSTPIPSSGLDTTTDAAKIQLDNLATEVLQAMAGDTPVTAVVPDGSITTPKLADGAVTGEKLSGYPGTYLDSDDIDDVTAPGLYVLPNNGILFVFTTDTSTAGTAQLHIDAHCRVIYRSRLGDNAWSPRQYYIIPDNSITTGKIVNKAVTAEKLADEVTDQLERIYPYYSQYNYDIDLIEEDCIRIVGGATTGTKPPGAGYAIVFTYYPRGANGDTDGYYRVQTAIVESGGVYTRSCYSIPPAAPSWSAWESLGGDIPDGSITADKLAEESVNFEKLSADMLARAKSFITEISGDGQPQAIPLPLGSGFSADKTYKLSIEARLVSGGGTVDLGPNMPTASAGYYHWDNTGDYLTLTSDWQTAWVDNVQGITSAGLQLYGSTSPVTVQLRNIRLTDADGNDVIDQQALREVGTCIPSPDDSPDTRPENKVLPTLAYVKDMLAKLEARIAALEGGSE